VSTPVILLTPDVSICPSLRHLPKPTIVSFWLRSNMLLPFDRSNHWPMAHGSPMPLGWVWSGCRCKCKPLFDTTDFSTFMLLHLKLEIDVPGQEAEHMDQALTAGREMVRLIEMAYAHQHDLGM
jgi:hypothetical protein